MWPKEKRRWQVSRGHRSREPPSSWSHPRTPLHQFTGVNVNLDPIPHFSLLECKILFWQKQLVAATINCSLNSTLPQICSGGKEAVINGPFHPRSGVFFPAHREANRTAGMVLSCGAVRLNYSISARFIVTRIPLCLCAKQLQTAVPTGEGPRRRPGSVRIRLTSMDLLPFSRLFWFFIPLLLLHSFVNTSYQPFSSPLQTRSARLWLPPPSPGAFSQPFSTWDPLRPANAAAKPSLHSNYWKSTTTQRWRGRCGRHHVPVLAIRHSQRFVLWDLVCCDTRIVIVAWAEIINQPPLLHAETRLTLGRKDDGSENTDKWGPGRKPRNFQPTLGWESSLARLISKPLFPKPYTPPKLFGARAWSAQVELWL